jgi:uncharacterized protein
MDNRLGLLGLLACAASACTSADGPRAPAVIDARCDGQAGQPRVLVFSAENLWNHPSNPVAVQALLAMCGTRGYTVTASHDPAAFLEQLPDTDVVVFAVTSGPVMSKEARAVFEPWARGGGGVLGLHSATATEPGWPFFLDLMGGEFAGHGPGLFDGRLVVDDPAHPTTAGIAMPAFTRTDEWYSFARHPEAAGMHVVMSLDESSLSPDYPADLRMSYHAITWTHEQLGGRVFYTALGHMPDTYAQPWFADMLGRAIDWTAAGRTH